MAHEPAVRGECITLDQVRDLAIASPPDGPGNSEVPYPRPATRETPPLSHIWSVDAMATTVPSASIRTPGPAMSPPAARTAAIRSNTCLPKPSRSTDGTTTRSARPALTSASAALATRNQRTRHRPAREHNPSNQYNSKDQPLHHFQGLDLPRWRRPVRSHCCHPLLSHPAGTLGGRERLPSDAWQEVS